MEIRTDTFGDGLRNYDIHHEIARGSTSIVYLATCRRGRLRNRKIALKKIIKQSDTYGVRTSTTSTALHNSLYHPSIASLLGTFSTPSSQYHVTELCPNGTLHDLLHSRHPPVLSEAELRGVLKSLVGALVYLHKKHIIYGNVQTSKILLSEDCRVKLSDFGLAVQVESSSSTAETFCDTVNSNFVSPEIIERRPYSFPTDLWSLGYLALTCLSGNSSFESSQTAQIIAKISRCQLDLPDTVSYEARDLIGSLLQIDPSHRIPLHRILSHPFFNPSHPISPLKISSVPIPSSSTSSTLLSSPSLRDSNKKNSEVPRRFQKIDKPSVDPLLGSSHKTMNKAGRRVFSDPIAASRLRSTSGDTRTRSVSSYASLRLEDTKVGATQPCPQPFAAQRSRSAMSGMATPALTTDSTSSGSGSGSDCDSGPPGSDDDVASDIVYEKPMKWARHQVPSKYSTCDDPMVEFLKSHPLLLPPKTSKETIDKCRQSKGNSQMQSKSTACLRTNRPALSVRGSLGPHVTGSSRKGPEATDLLRSCAGLLNTAHLTPKTHKLSNGNVTVLPSKALLVDFREGERRKGRKGDQVFVVNPDGKMVKVYDAPHLSTPCCLAEAISEYLVDDLPPPLARQYADAARVVDKLKQRVPKLTLHEDDAQYTLMANEPFGNIEITLEAATRSYLGLHKPKPTPTGQPGSDLGTTTARLRLVRAHRTIEISRSSSRVRDNGEPTGSWTKKIIPTTGREYQVQVPEEEVDLLDDTDLEGLKRLYRFLKICEAVEKIANLDLGHLPLRAKSRRVGITENDSESQDDNSTGEKTFRVEHNTSRDTSATWIPDAPSDTACNTSPSAQSHPLSSIRVLPRPPKLRNISASLASNLADIGDSRRNWSVNTSIPVRSGCH